jgi:hypothetical protein
MKYEAPEPIERDQAAVELASDDVERMSLALLRLALHDPDPSWLQQILLPYLGHHHRWVRGVAAMCLGHVARIHGILDEETVVPAIRELLDDPTTKGQAQDALDDIEMFLERDAGR